MTALALDIALRGATASLLLLAALVFARDGRSYAARFGVGLCLCAIAYLVVETRGVAAMPALHMAAGVLGNLSIPLFWLFTRAWFDDGFQPRGRDLAIALGFASLRLCHLLIGLPLGGWPSQLSGLATYLAGTALAGHALWLAWQGRDADLVEPRRRLRGAFVVAVGGFILWALASEAYGRRTGRFPQWPTVNAALLGSIVLALAAALLALRRGDMFPLPPGVPAEEEPPPPADPRLAATLEQLIRHDRIYRTDGLTIGQVAARLEVPDYRLRQLINGQLGFRNFNDYLNHHRLAEVKAALADPGQAPVPILTIAMDAGFGSLAPFNRAFKAATGTTPRAFRATALGEGAAA